MIIRYAGYSVEIKRLTFEVARKIFTAQKAHEHLAQALQALTDEAMNGSSTKLQRLNQKIRRLNKQLQRHDASIRTSDYEKRT